MTNFETLRLFLEDPSFCHIRRISNVTPLTYREFKKLPLPAGFTPEEVWEILQLIRWQERVDVYRTCIPGSSRQGKTLPAWFKWNNALGDCSREAMSLLSKDSYLDKRYRRMPTPELIATSLIKGIKPVLHYDQPRLSPTDAKRALRGLKEPENIYEEVLLRIRNFLAEDDLGAYDLSTPEGILDLYGKVGIENEVIRRHTKIEQIKHLAKVIELTSGNKMQLNAYMSVATEIPYSIIHNRAFDAWSAIMGSLISKVYFVQRNDLVLANLPLIEIQISDRFRKKRYPDLIIPRPDQKQVFKDTIDKTEFDTTFMMAVKAVLLAEQDYEKHQECRETTLVAHVKADQRLNMRQADVLESLITGKTTRLSIGDLQARYGTAYATSRADVMGLEQMGYLTSYKSGRAFWYLLNKPYLERLLKTE